MGHAAAANIVVVAVVAAMLLAAAHTADAAISCGQVNSALGPCLTYARGGAGPSAVCCSGVKRLAAATQTTADRRAACNCLKIYEAPIRPELVYRRTARRRYSDTQDTASIRVSQEYHDFRFKKKENKLDTHCGDGRIRAGHGKDVASLKPNKKPMSLIGRGTAGARRRRRLESPYLPRRRLG
ncbi:hypothetical protein CFC21_057164 [Triticum aestivum]|uniref:Non-specific lipid-transfer protein n=2 Tax=Triticum aestivum TaxID=4565 RepID=A0A9R1KBY6_WHEAT|nr:hypothetical protein CFC21_057164 [Triticum aestivum]